MLSTLLLVVLVILLLGAIPNWNYNQAWGYGPAGFLFTLLIIFIVLRLLGIA